jgi:hypothetical protein
LLTRTLEQLFQPGCFIGRRGYDGDLQSPLQRIHGKIPLLSLDACS